MDDFELGLYEKLISKEEKESLEKKEISDPSISIEARKLKMDDEIAQSSDILSDYFKDILKQTLESTSGEKNEKIKKQIQICNNLIHYLQDNFSNDEINYEIPEDKHLLLSITKSDRVFERPFMPISISSLFTGGSQVIALYEELKKEIASSDEVFFLVAFIKNTGINQLMATLKQFTDRGGRLNILTTTYTHVTEKSAIDKLANLKNTTIKISYDESTTRLHAKAYIFKRKTGFNVAFIGSSNLSRAAINDGLEWNVKLTSHDVPQVFTNIEEIYQRYWNSNDFELYDPSDEECSKKLIKALETKEKSKSQDHMLFEVHPYPYQNQVLEELEAERSLHGNYRNLVVAATGTGKTVISAFDYKRSRSKGIENLLFIAHRDEILDKSQKTFQSILRNKDFGDLYSECNRFSEHLFITVQSLNRRLKEKDPKVLPAPDKYDFIIIDEVHHSAAKSYQPIFDYFKPKILLGLTATPERMDGRDILPYFNNRFSSEIRLAEAINRELIVPFQYYGISDITDISSVKYIKGRLDETRLGEIYEHNTERAQYIVDKVREYMPDVEKIKGLGFCVNIEHAKFMAQQFEKCGYKSISVTSDPSDYDNRETCYNKLVSGEVQFIFTVDLFNEGIDIPPINLELFLRPTESLTVFIQQLGRGLRHSDNKSELTVLDFVAQADKNYNVYVKKLNYMSSQTTQKLSDKIKRGFSGLPAGCSIELEKRAKEYVLSTIDRALDKARMVTKVKEYFIINNRLPSLRDLLDYLELKNSQVFKIYNKYTLTYLCHAAENKPIDNLKFDEIVAKGLKKMCFMNANSWFNEIKELLDSNTKVSNSDVNALMLFYTFYSDAPAETESPITGRPYTDLNQFVDELRYSEYIDEIHELIDICQSEIKFIETESGSPTCLLRVYCSYYREQIFVAMGKNTFDRKFEHREGVYYDKPSNTDYFLVTLNKSEKDFSPTTTYKDYAINDRLFHWESQSTTPAHSPTGKRYINGSSDKLLFVRKNIKIEGITSPFVFIGKGQQIKSQGSKPIQIIWEMNHKIPEDIVRQSGVM